MAPHQVLGQTWGEWFTMQSIMHHTAAQACCGREVAPGSHMIPSKMIILSKCRYCYEMAAHQVLGQTWGEWFTKKAHQYGTSASALTSKLNVGLMYVDLRSFGKEGTMHLMEIAE